jgi:DNA (cytosine-5)-methyltransferase 1
VQVRRVISLYSGAGGLDLGLEAAGFQVGVCVEMDASCVRTLRHNRSWRIIADDIHAVSTSRLLEEAGFGVGEADLLSGGPPCQPFSKSAYWVRGDTRRLEDPRSSTLGEFMRVLEEALPSAFLLENVYGLTYEGKDEGMRFLLDRIADINARKGTAYSFQFKVLNAADYGVPQIRERVFLIGSREGIQFEFPPARHVDPSRMPEQRSFFPLEPYRTAWDGIGDLDDINHGDSLRVRGKWADLLPSIPEGQNYLWHTDRGGGMPLFRWRSRYWSMLLKLAKDRPSWTIQAQPGSAIGPFHWRNRRLSPREMARLQTFPDGFEVIGGITSIQRQLGNAVPSALAEMLGLEIRRQFFGDSVRDELTLIPAARTPPAKQPTMPVPARFTRGGVLAPL